LGNPKKFGFDAKSGQNRKNIKAGTVEATNLRKRKDHLAKPCEEKNPNGFCKWLVG